MSNLFGKVEKLRGRSFDELRVRGAQLVAARAEAFGWLKSARLPTDAELMRFLDTRRFSCEAKSPNDLLAHFRARHKIKDAPRFFASFDDPTKTVAEWRKRFATSDAERLIARASRIREGVFDLLGFKNLRFGSPPDWLLEPVAEKRAPLAHWSEIDYLNPDVAGDKKITWELNRCQHFLTLGRAYLLTGDESFAETFARHLASWMDANPPKRGINWASSLEVAFRSIAWIWSFHFFKDSPRLTPELFARALKFLYVNARHLETYLSIYFSPNTHLTGEALGLFYIGAIFPEFKRAHVWREKGARILFDAVQWQIRADGTYFEQSSYYARYTADFYAHLLILARRNNLELPAVVETKLQRLLEHLMHIARPDGATPFYGDDDGGRLITLDERAANDFRAALSNGAVLFGRADFKFAARHAAEETLWLCGAEAVEAFDKLGARAPRQTSIAFRDGGVFVMRDGWTRDASMMLIDCGAHGAMNCGHAHADALAFDLSMNGRQVFVDAGTFTYTASKEGRNRFRSSQSHNTLTIDGESSSVPSSKPFAWNRIAQARVHDWRTNERFDFFSGSHDGYERLASPIAHARSVLFLKPDYFIIRDTVKTSSAHAYELNFQCAPEVKAQQLRDKDALRDSALFLCLDEAEEMSLRVSVFNTAGRGAFDVQSGFVSRCYGAREAADKLCFRAETAGDAEFVTFVLAAKVANAEQPNAREIEASGGRAFAVVTENLRDILLLSNGGERVETHRCASDAAWCWLRFDEREEELREVIMLEGSFIEIDGRRILNAPERIASFVARLERGAEETNGVWRIVQCEAECEFRPMVTKNVCPVS